MKKIVMLCAAVTMVAAGCGGGSAGCASIVDDGMVLFQDVIDEMDGLTLDQLNDPFDSPVWEERTVKLQERTDAEGCTDEEMADLFAEKVEILTADDTNPGGQLLISFFNQAVESGTFEFGG